MASTIASLTYLLLTVTLTSVMFTEGKSIETICVCEDLNGLKIPCECLPDQFIASPSNKNDLLQIEPYTNAQFDAKKVKNNNSGGFWKKLLPNFL